MPDRDPTPGDLDDRGLVARLVGGDAAAWEQFVRKHAPLVFAMVSRVLGGPSGDESDVEDAVQAVFAKLWDDDCRRLRTFRGTSRLSTWVAAIARRQALDHLRSRKRRDSHVAASIDGVDALADRLAAEVEGPEERMAAKDLARALEAALALLGARDRLLLAWIHVDGLTYADVASLLGVRENSIGPLLGRARKRLHALLEAPRPAPLYGSDAAAPPTRRSGTQ